MGDVIEVFGVRSSTGERARPLRLYFDSGSPCTFIKISACRGFKNLLPLAKPKPFGGLGDGAFRATHILDMEVRLLGIWCRHPTYVIPDDVLSDKEDVLIGHDFMQKFDVNIHSRQKRVVLDSASLRAAQIVRRVQ